MAKKIKNNEVDEKEISAKLEADYQHWVDVYFKFNKNGRLTSKQIKPHLTMGSAEVDAARMLGNVRVKELIEMKHAHIKMKEEIELSWIIENLNKVIIDCSLEQVERDDAGKITSKPDRANLIKAVDLLAKISGAYAPTKTEVSGEINNKIIKVSYKKDKE
jgi:hypothetical protein